MTAKNNGAVTCYTPNGNHCGPYEESKVSGTLGTRYHYGAGGDGALIVTYVVQMDGSSKADISKDITPTLTVQDKQSKVMAVMFENHAHDSRYTGPLTVAQTVSQLFGTGGNNTPLIVESIWQPQDASIPEPTVINSSGGGLPKHSMPATGKARLAGATEKGNLWS